MSEHVQRDEPSDDYMCIEKRFPRYFGMKLQGASGYMCIDEPIVVALWNARALGYL